jgi:putative ATPase
MTFSPPDLFSSPEKTPAGADRNQPLARRLRPRKLAEIVGQDHLLGPKSLLPRLVRENNFGSLIFYGPPGCGKTSFAEAIVAETGGHCFRLNAVLSNVAELRDVLKTARSRPELRAVLFIDEIHRFNKSQQDSLLPDVENGHVRLIGATTQNPGFSVIPALLSRSHLFRLEPLLPEVMRDVLVKALADKERGLGNTRCTADPEVIEALVSIGGGDLRRSLNALETLVLSQPVGGHIGQSEIDGFVTERQLRYDRDEDEHYDTASAFIKSIRGGDPDAALYWLAKMLLGQEDPRFIARRLVILASEDVGMADPRALPMAVAAFQACELVGLPECEINLAHATVFLATCPKSNRSYLGLQAAKKAIKDGGVQPVPSWLRDKHGAANRAAGNALGYLYSHDYPSAISGQEFLQEPQVFYEPGNQGMEPAVAERLLTWKKLKQQIQSQNQ